MDEIKEVLISLQKDGLLHPDAVVEAARNPASPLHDFFTWDDTEAAEKYRQDEARQLIRSIKIEVDTGVPVEVRAFVSLSADRQNGAGYRQFTEVMDSEFLRAQLMNDIDAKIHGWEKQAKIIGAIIDFSPMRIASDKIRKG
jgi:hypothetical protein